MRGLRWSRGAGRERTEKERCGTGLLYGDRPARAGRTRRRWSGVRACDPPGRGSPEREWDRTDNVCFSILHAPPAAGVTMPELRMDAGFFSRTPRAHRGAQAPLRGTRAPCRAGSGEGREKKAGSARRFSQENKSNVGILAIPSTSKRRRTRQRERRLPVRSAAPGASSFLISFRSGASCRSVRNPAPGWRRPPSGERRPGPSAGRRSRAARPWRRIRPFLTRERRPVRVPRACS
jgi:hypothetical protein